MSLTTDPRKKCAVLACKNEGADEDGDLRRDAIQPAVGRPALSDRTHSLLQLSHSRPKDAVIAVTAPREFRAETRSADRTRRAPVVPGLTATNRSAGQSSRGTVIV